jgi:DNA-3-methyladenine glycosylase II
LNIWKLATLDEKSLKRGCDALAKRDADLRFVLNTHGVPPLWKREEGFATLVHIILEQQVSLASARAAFTRLQETLARVTPQRFLKLDDETLKAIGFSRQKTLYSRTLAQAVIEKRIDLAAFTKMKDEEVRATLKNLKGIGDWTVDIYLLMALVRADAWPNGDLALAVAAQKLKQLEMRPTPAELQTLAESWRPFRAVAARLLWHYYLSERTK